jgi:adenosylcobyric acid synthase
LGLIEARTTFEPDKITRHSVGKVMAPVGPLASITGTVVRGYEIHDGVTQHTGSALLEIGSGDEARLDGAVSASGHVIGTYLHGFLDNAEVLRAVSDVLRIHASPSAQSAIVDLELDRLADIFQTSVDVARIDALLGVD